MKWVNVGTHTEWGLYGDVSTEVNNAVATETGYDVLHSSSSSSSENTGYIIKKLDSEYDECWFSFNFRHYAAGSSTTSHGVYVGFDSNNSSVTNTIPLVHLDTSATDVRVTLDKKFYYNYRWYHTILYDPSKTLSTSDKKIHNVEIHLKTGTDGRVDVWFDHKLAFSYRSPSDFADMKISYAKIICVGTTYTQYSSFIIQDTRRIGYEKFVKLTIDPDTEQNMPQGSTTNFTLSGLSDSSEYSDITGVCAVLQATSRDANISTGTYTLNGANVGTIDVSDSSGKAYETAHAETNSITGLPWTRDNIEGKTLSFTVNGAS